MSACLDEEQTLGYLAGALPPATLEEVELHLDSCVTCRELVRVCARADSADISSDGPTLPAATQSGVAAGATVGRFVVGERLGIGGMGVVYAAYDPQLDRKVALKFLSPDAFAGSSAGETATQLYDEARAMAQLAHPNVVAVHDVGVAGSDVFVAMELVEGRTLSVWLRETPRTWQQIRDAFVQAARGLIAAHDAGLVHGDFKPDNVIVGVDGRVRVLDFGLAVSTTAAAPAGLRGTPGFIAPELRKGHPPDARSDQFSFCVALWRAWYGELPPASEASGVPIPAHARQRIDRSAPAKAPPRWARRLVERGLSLAPAGRFPSLAELVAALERDPWHKPRQAALAAGVVVSLAAGIVGVQHARRAANLCGGAAHELAGVWNQARKDAIARSFAASRLPYAADSLRAVDAALDRYGASWAAAHTDACQATHVRHERSEQLLDRSMECLTRRLHALDAVADALGAADASVVQTAVHATEELPPVEECSSPATMEARERRPTDAPTKQRIEQIERDLERGATLFSLGQFRAGRDLAAHLVDDAAKLGLPSLHADALILLGRLQTATAETDVAQATLRDAVREATGAGSDHRAARALIEEANSSARNEKFADAVERARDADAVLVRLGGDRDLQAHLDHTRGIALEMLGQYDEAEKSERRALAVFEAGGDRSHREQTSLVLSSLGSIKSDRGEYDEAQKLHERALAMAEALLGKEHPTIVKLLSKLGNTLNNSERYEEARAAFTRAVAIADKSLPPNHPLTAEALEMLATSLVNLHRPAEAVGYAERALAIHERSVPAQGRMAGFCHGVLAEAFRLQGKLDEALAHANKSVELMERTQGPKSDDVAEQLTVVGRVLLQRKEWAEAAKIEARAAAIFEGGQVGEKHPDLPAALTEEGAALIGLGDARAALVVLERADRLRDRAGAAPLDRAQVRFVLGQALWRVGRDHRAAMVEEACTTFARDPAAADELAECKRWLADHPRRM